jgi:hypothetical protein
MTASSFIQPPVGTVPNTARGEVLLPVVEGGARYPVRFSLRVLHDYTIITGKSLMDIGELLTSDFIGTVGQLVASAVRCCVPSAVVPVGYDVGDALDLVDRLSAEETTTLMDAVMQAVRIDQTPLFQALIAKSQSLSTPAEANGASTSTSPLVS